MSNEEVKESAAISDVSEINPFADSDDQISPEGYILHNGWAINTEGEVVGRVDASGKIKKDSFHVTDERSADWVVGAVGKHEGALLGHWEYLSQCLENAAKSIRREKAVLTYLHATYDHEIAEYAKTVIDLDKPGGKRSVKTPLGTYGFRKTPAGLDILDEEKAVVILEGLGRTWPQFLEAVKVVKTILKKKLVEVLEQKTPTIAEMTPAQWAFGDGVVSDRPAGIKFYATSGLATKTKQAELECARQVKALREASLEGEE